MEEGVTGGVLFRVAAPHSDERSLRLLASALSRTLAQRAIPAVAELMAGTHPPTVEVRSFGPVSVSFPQQTVVLSEHWNPESEAERLVTARFPASPGEWHSDRRLSPPPACCTDP